MIFSRWTYGIGLMALIVRLGVLFAQKTFPTVSSSEREHESESITKIENRENITNTENTENMMPTDTWQQQSDSLDWSDWTMSDSTENVVRIDEENEENKENKEIYTTSQNNLSASLTQTILSQASAISLSKQSDRRHMQEQYDTWREELLVPLIEKLLDVFQFSLAYDYIITAQKNGDLDSLDPHTVMYGLLNSPLVSQQSDTKTLSDFVGYYGDRGLLTSQDTVFYGCLIDIAGGNRTTCDSLYATRNTAPYDIYAQWLLERRSLRTRFPDMDIWYKHGMLALHLFEHGYFALAQNVSIKLVLSYPQYILPKQILWYSHFVMHNWSNAQAYFLELVDVDVVNRDLYRFMIWVSNYWLGDNYEALLYLQQSTEQPDAIRYMIIAQSNLWNKEETFRLYKKLWSLWSIFAADYVALSEDYLYDTWIWWISLAEKAFFEQVIQWCNATPDICAYTKAWFLLHEWQDSTSWKSWLQKAGELLISSTIMSPYRHYILWEYYLARNEKTMAIQHFAKAIMGSTDETLTTKAQRQLESLT